LKPSKEKRVLSSSLSIRVVVKVDPSAMKWCLV
jgi:hypothetical protein